MKPLLPSLKEKKRYLAFEVVSKKKLGFKPVSDAIWQSLLGYLGTKGAAKAGIWLLPEYYNKGKGIIKVNNKEVNNLKAGLTLIDSIEGEDVIVKSIGVSGMLNKAKERYIAS